MDTSSVLTATEIQQMDSCTGGEYGNCSGNAEPLIMSYDLLKTITNDFPKELGRGSFGVVYKGALANGKEIAVKVLEDRAALDEKSFNNECQNLARFKHQNIVQLLGYCNEYKLIEGQFLVQNGTNIPIEKKHAALCFEYVEKGSLHPFISGENHQLLDWDTCYKIIKGVCEGLKHLREGLDKPVWHFDLKPDNILLDSNMMPKIADFGLSRIIGDEKTRRTTTECIGTCGYVPPEFMRFQLLTREFNIFSLGVIIAKIMVGTKGYNEWADMPPRKLVKHVQNIIWKPKLQQIVKPGSLEVYCHQVKACIELASKCLSEDRKQRPEIKQIIMTLNETETMMIPHMPLEIKQFHDGKTNFPSNNRSIKIMSSSGGGKDSSSSYGKNSPNHPYLMPRELPFDILEKITNDFSNKSLVGRGSFGTVYKGVYEDGQVIAVKLLHPSFNRHRDKEDFLNDATVHGKCNHENIVQLLGFTYEEKEEIIQHNRRSIMAVSIKRALCYEYLPNGSLQQHITDESHGLDWRTRYKIIKGICDGLRYLHDIHIYHLNLNPRNIFLDQNMVPKIGGLGLSRTMGSERTATTLNAIGPLTYMPPEYINKGLISKSFEVYSLGLTIMEMMIGGRSYFDGEMPPHEVIKLIVEKWRTRLDATWKGRSVEGYCQQVKKCLEIALACVEEDRHKRPRITDIVHMLSETETLIAPLDVHPMELVFAVKPKRHAPCLLQLHNKHDDCVVFRLVSKNPRRYLTKLPLYGVVPPRCTYTLSLTTTMLKQRPQQECDDVFVLHSVAVSDRNKQYKLAEYESLLNDEVQEVTLKAVCALQGEAGSSDIVTRPTIEVIATVNAKRVSSIEVNPKMRWLMTNHESGNLRVWNYKTLEEVLNPFEALDTEVSVAKFVEREEWIVAGDSDGCIHVRSYDESRDATSFEAHSGRIMSLAVHPTDSYVLSSSDDDHLIMLWHWDPYWDFDKGRWVCTRTFDGHSGIVAQLIFNPEDKRSFASASLDGTAKIWSLDSDVCKTTFDEHPDGLTCVDYFTGDDREHGIITGSKDGTAQIWDLNTKRRVENLEGHVDKICVVYCNLALQKFITGSLDGTVHIWDSATYRLDNVIALNLGTVYGVGYIEDFERIVVGCHEGIAMVEINSP